VTRGHPCDYAHYTHYACPDVHPNIGTEKSISRKSLERIESILTLKKKKKKQQKKELF
jgi:hypothetical protein